MTTPNDDSTQEAASLHALDGRPDEVETPEPEKWVVVVMMGKDWGDMMRGLRDQATQLHIDAERSGAPSTWGISGRYAYWSGVGGRPSLDEIASLVEKARSSIADVSDCGDKI